MTEHELINKYCYDHDLTFFIDSDGKYCLCDVDWIIRLDTKQELMEFIKDN